ncbi:hypothetical protein BJ912DRAFT_192352 [Pholiota molesta]|nr:hypothetical protein BJ912DRAFT_192352 [Pholiota molesta]
MSESQAQNSQANTADVEPDRTAAKEPDTKPVDIDAPYEHGPPKDGDPWTTVLTPELEADTLRCNAWKDEVQNLLIFAGLFSAVVTTFIVESYKLLLPDPNAAMTGLLFHIASGLNNNSPLPPSVSPDSILAPFSRTPTAVRINVFWFISLILSLTTVLVGTIALQWLREHQSYGGYSSKEKFAMLHMRSEAIEAWYLPQIFAMLPLLLQAALVLFLAGLIDFSLPLGMKLTIPVSIIIGLTLLFLAATTILPSLQGLSFFCGLYPRKSLPTPCPFKSPQSHAFRTLFGIVLRTIFHIIPSPSLDYDSSSPNKEDWHWKIKNRSLLIADHLVESVYTTWNQRTWPTLDRKWLALRDACHQHILDHDPNLYHHQTCWEDSFPLSDATQYLVEVANQTPGFKHTDSYLAALVHCFNELAESIWIASDEWAFEFVRKDRRSNYFEAIYPMLCESCSLAKFLLHGGVYKLDQLDQTTLVDYFEHPEVKSRLFSTDQTMIFLRLLLNNHPSPALLKYQQELWVRVLHLISNIVPLTPAITDGSKSIPFPTIIDQSIVYNMVFQGLTPGQQYLNMANILTTIFQLAASHHHSQIGQKSPFLHTQRWLMCLVLWHLD